MKIISDRAHFTEFVQKCIPLAKKFLWIATSDLKNMYVLKNKKSVPLLEVLSDLIGDSVSVRLIHAKEPGPIFRKEFDGYPNLFHGLERMLCPRMHAKLVIIDGKMAYMGSANLTGAGLGMKSANKRNFELGITTTDKIVLDELMSYFDSVWMGSHCDDCRRKEFCLDPVT